MFITLLNNYYSISTRSVKETFPIRMISLSFKFSFGQSEKRLDQNTQIILARKYLCPHTSPQTSVFQLKNVFLFSFFIDRRLILFCSKRMTIKYEKLEAIMSSVLTSQKTHFEPSFMRNYFN